MIYELVYTYHDLLYYQVMQCNPVTHIKHYIAQLRSTSYSCFGQLENTEMLEQKQEGTSEIEVKILDWTAYHSMIVVSSSQAPCDSGYA